jgi:hypothetical protein
MELTGIIFIIVIALFSFLGFWKPNTILFMMLSAGSMMLGLSMPDIISPASSTTGMDIAVSLGLIFYSFLCSAWAFKLMFWKQEENQE